MKTQQRRQQAPRLIGR